MTDELITTAQAAERLGCSVGQVKALCQEGALKATKFGHVWQIESSSLAGVTLGAGGRGRKRKEEGK